MLYSILSGNTSFIEIVMHIVAVILVIVLILPFHELAHGYIAYKLGDDTAKKAGRLTFNPLHHIDYVGALCMLLLGFGWADPVPVNPYNFKNPRKDMALVALAGPAANMIAALVGGLIQNAFLCFVPATTAAWWKTVRSSTPTAPTTSTSTTSSDALPTPRCAPSSSRSSGSTRQALAFIP